MGGKGSARRRGFRPQVERLDERIVPADVFWTGAGANDFASNPANYFGGALPANGDTVVLDGIPRLFVGIPPILVGNPNKPIDFDGAFNVQLGGLRVLDGYTGNVDVNTNIFLPTLSLDVQRMTVFVGNTVTAHQATIYDAYLEGGGTFAVTGGVVDPGHLSFNGAGAGDQRIAALNFDGNSSMVVNGETIFVSTQITNNGTLVWTGVDDIRLRNNAKLTNNGTFRILSNAMLIGSGVRSSTTAPSSRKALQASRKSTASSRRTRRVRSSSEREPSLLRATVPTRTSSRSRRRRRP